MSEKKMKKDYRKCSHEEKKVFVINQFYPPDYAPTGQLIHELVTELGYQGNSLKVFTGQPGYVYQEKTAKRKEIIDTSIVVQRTRAAQFWPQRVRGKVVNGLLFFIRAGLHLLKNLKKGDTLLLTSAPPFLPFLGYLLHKIAGINYTCLIYDLYPDVAIELGVVSRNHLVVKFWQLFNQLTWRNAQKVIVLSDSMKNRIVMQCTQISHKIEVIHNWANPDVIKPIEKSHNWFTLKYNLQNKYTVLYSGNMGRCHDMETILKTAHRLRHEQIQFLFIGGGAKLKTSQEMVKAWKLQNCLFLPYQDRQDLPYSLSSCDLSLVSIAEGMEGVVAPSKFYSILASGRPVAVICESHSYIRAILDEAKCGVAFNNGDDAGLFEFILKLAADPALGIRMGQAGRNYLKERFTPEIIAKEYAKVLGLQKEVQPRAQVKNSGYIKNAIKLRSNLEK